MEQRLTIITLGVSDLKNSNAFYESNFGWKKLPSSNENITFFQLNGILLSLYPIDKLAEDAGLPAGNSNFRSFTMSHNVRSEEEVNQLFQVLERKGVQVIKKPEKVFWGGYSGYVADPDNNLWEIAYNPFLELDEKGNAIE